MLALVGHDTVGVVGHVGRRTGSGDEVGERRVSEGGRRCMGEEAVGLVLRCDRLMTGRRVEAVDARAVPAVEVASDFVLETRAGLLELGRRGGRWLGGAAAVPRRLRGKWLLVVAAAAGSVVGGGEAGLT